MDKEPVFWIIDDEWPEHLIEIQALRKAYPNCKIHESGIPFHQDLDACSAETDIISAQITAHINAAIIDRLSNCRGIAVFGSGFDNIDVSAANRRGISVTNVNGYCTQDIADYVLSAIFHVYKPIYRFSSCISGGQWGAQAFDQLVHRLDRQTLLLLGFGRIGSVTAARATALDMEVLVYDPYLSPEDIRRSGAVPVSLEAGLARADFVSVHIRPTAQTINFVDIDLLRQMKKTAVLINTSRGSLVCEADLIHAVEAGIIGGAVLDVTSQEPLPPDSPLLQTKNILVTPHISFASQESITELRQRAVQNALEMYRGEIPQDLIRI